MAQQFTNLEQSDVQGWIDAAVEPLEQRIAALEQGGGSGGETGPSGIAMKTDVPNGWKVAIAEDFNIDASNTADFDAKYNSRGITHYPSNYPDTRSNQGKSDGGYYDAPITVVDGALVCHMTIGSNGKARCMSLVPRPTDDGKWGDSPGLIWEECTKMTFSNGFKAAHLSWPKSNDSTPDGEIDFPEFDRDDAVKAFLHHQGATQNSDQKEFTSDEYPDEWHVYRTVWKMGEYVEFSIDGQLIAPRYTTRIPSTPMHLSMQNETWLRSDPVPRDATGTIEVDWLRVMIPADY